jgi:hypothetical protein
LIRLDFRSNFYRNLFQSTLKMIIIFKKLVLGWCIGDVWKRKGPSESGWLPDWFWLEPRDAQPLSATNKERVWLKRWLNKLRRVMGSRSLTLHTHTYTYTTHDIMPYACTQHAGDGGTGAVFMRVVSPFANFRRCSFVKQ